MDRAVDDRDNIGVVSRETGHASSSTAVTHRLWIVESAHVSESPCPRKSQRRVLGDLRRRSGSPAMQADVLVASKTENRPYVLASSCRP